MTWQELYKDKVLSPEAAVAKIKDGDHVRVMHLDSTPALLWAVLAKRSDELRDVKIYSGHPVLPFDWTNPKHVGHFELRPMFVSPETREAMDARLVDFWPVAWACVDDVLNRDDPDNYSYKPNVVLTQVSPPDANGYCSLGGQVWYQLPMIERAGLVIAEVNPTFIRTYGTSTVHVSDIDFLVPQPTTQHKSGSESETLLTRSIKAEDIEAAEVIADYIATLLIHDGDCLEIGYGLVPNAVASRLVVKNDIGVHSEILSSGLMSLMKKGVITGKRKQIDVGRAVATGLVIDPKDREFVHMNPSIELRGVEYVNNPRVIMQNDNHVAINAALSIDLTGQLAVESFGGKVYSGTGGQLDHVLGAAMSKGGRSITTLPSTAAGGKISRIVAQHPAGQLISVPRLLVDYVVSEFGIASLQWKTQRQRVEELINIAHPDFRDQLREEARRLYWP